MYQAVITTPLGKLGLKIQAEKLAQLDWLPAKQAQSSDGQAVTEKIIQQLNHFFRDPTLRWEVPLALAGTPFQQRVLRALQEIPVGKVVTYGQLARQLHTSPRAIGQACRSNPLPIVIPCHRVVAARGLGGYAGAVSGRQLRIKEWLLRHEGYVI